MAQKVEDFNLPMTAISKIIKDTIPEGVKVTEAAKLALNRAASVFILYATSSSNSLAQEDNRKRLLAKDVLEALKELELDVYIPPLQPSVNTFRKSLETKKQAKVSRKASNHVEESETLEEEEETADNMEVQVIEEPYDVIELDDDSESGNEEANNDSEDSSERE